MNFDKDELAKLPPKERIKKLKEIEEASKREMQKAERLLKESQELMKSSENEWTQSEVNKEKERPPEDRIDITDLMPQEENIEQTVQGTKDEEKTDIKDLYGRISDIADTGVTEYSAQQLGEIYDEINEMHDYALQKYGTATEDFEETASSAKRMIKELLGDHYSSNKYHPA